MKTFRATVMTRNVWGVDTLREVSIQAQTYMDPQVLLEGQYGFGSVRQLVEQ